MIEQTSLYVTDYGDKVLLGVHGVIILLDGSLGVRVGIGLRI